MTMAQVLVLYYTPSDPAAFDSYYRATHVPIAKRLPGLLSYTINAQAPRMVAGTAPHLVAELEFADLTAVDAALASPEGQATAADLANFAQAGVTIMIFETEKV
jgi:uncharacterized protein (TIGR02118 family)